MMTNEEKKALFAAWIDGKPIQYRWHKDIGWTDFKANYVPSWNFEQVDYRVKPEDITDFLMALEPVDKLKQKIENLEAANSELKNDILELRQMRDWTASANSVLQEKNTKIEQEIKVLEHKNVNSALRIENLEKQNSANSEGAVYWHNAFLDSATEVNTLKSRIKQEDQGRIKTLEMCLAAEKKAVDIWYNNYCESENKQQALREKLGKIALALREALEYDKSNYNDNTCCGQIADPIRAL